MHKALERSLRKVRDKKTGDIDVDKLMGIIDATYTHFDEERRRVE